MEHLIEHYIDFMDANLRGFVFGFAHVSIVIIGFYSGWSINRLFKFVSKGHIAGIFGATLAHIVADLVASLLDPHIRSMVVGIVAGGLVPLMVIPILDKLTDEGGDTSFKKKHKEGG